MAQELDMCLVHKAQDYDTALEYLLSYTYDIVILDIIAGVNGFELLRNSVSRGFPAVMSTAHALTPDALKKSIKLGAVSSLPKKETPGAYNLSGGCCSGQGKPVWQKLFERLGAYFHIRFGPTGGRDQFKEFEEEMRRSVSGSLEIRADTSGLVAGNYEDMAQQVTAI